jgi:hypothetical protein
LEIDKVMTTKSNLGIFIKFIRSIPFSIWLTTTGKCHQCGWDRMDSLIIWTDFQWSLESMISADCFQVHACIKMPHWTSQWLLETRISDNQTPVFDSADSFEHLVQQKVSTWSNAIFLSNLIEFGHYVPVL